MIIPVSSFGKSPYSYFQGTWKLNKKASQNYEALLVFQGRSWLERKTLNSLEMTQVIKVSGKQIIIKAITSIKSIRFTLHIDGIVRKKKI